MPVIYVLKDPVTDEVRYVGKTNDLTSRIRCHKWEKRHLKKRNHKVRWLRTLTADPTVEVLETVSEDNWVERERYWIQHYRDQGARLTNIAEGGEGWTTGKKHSEASNAKNRAAALARGATPPSRRGAVPWNKGIKGSIKPNRGTFQKGQAAWNQGQRRTHCIRGHELKAENRYYTPAGIYRGCKLCFRITAAARTKAGG